MVPACSSGPLTIYGASTLEYHAAETGHDIPPCHSIPTQGQPMIKLSIDVECDTGSHNYSFQCLGYDPTKSNFQDLSHLSLTIYRTTMQMLLHSVGSPLES